MSPGKGRTKSKVPDLTRLAEQVKAGEVRSVSRLLTLVENQDPAGQEALRKLEPIAGRPAIVGITGYPGAGKSTLIAQLTTAYRRQGYKVGIIAVDATSPITGGALLGDRIRMQDHACDRDVFIRSVASRGHHGGLSSATPALVRVLAAAGYGVVLVETVGVGQDEVEVAGIAQTVVAVVAPGLGDEVQAMKAGLLEVAHIVVVNKGDHDGADETIHQLQDWVTKVVRTVAIKGEGIPELVEAIATHQREVDLKGGAG